MNEISGVNKNRNINTRWTHIDNEMVGPLTIAQLWMKINRIFLLFRAHTGCVKVFLWGAVDFRVFFLFELTTPTFCWTIYNLFRKLQLIYSQSMNIKGMLYWTFQRKQIFSKCFKINTVLGIFDQLPSRWHFKYLTITKINNNNCRYGKEYNFSSCSVTISHHLGVAFPTSVWFTKTNCFWEPKI